MGKKRCVIIGASPETDISSIAENVSDSDFKVCADGGITFAKKLGIRPDMVAGDFDSSDFPEDYDGEIIKLPVMKDDTDTMYCVKECLKRGFDEFVLLGMTGGREDHTYANLCTLLYIVRHNCTAKIIGSNREIFVMDGGCAEINNKIGHTFSVFPFSCDKCTVSLKGFLYELDKGVLTADFPLGVSNEITDGTAVITLHEGTAVIFIEKII